MTITRAQTQICSIFSIALGITLMICTPYLVPGVAMIGISIWIMLMSESVLLAKVENEMRSALEELSRKNKIEVEEVLYFLRQSSIAASPFESLGGAKKLCERILTPAMVLSVNHQIVKANSAMHEMLGWDHNTLGGVPAHTINDLVMMSKVGEYASRPENQAKKSILTHYVYISKAGEKIPGIMHASKIGVEGFFVLFYPESDCIVSRDGIVSLVKD